MNRPENNPIKGKLTKGKTVSNLAPSASGGKGLGVANKHKPADGGLSVQNKGKKI